MTEAARLIRVEQHAEQYKRTHPSAAAWAEGYGAIAHSLETQSRVFAMADALRDRDASGDGVEFFELLRAADRVASAAMWLVVHETYARNVYVDGRELTSDDFKPKPEGHTGGALNMVPAYAGYLAVNALSGLTRSWVMGQGHTVAAIDSLNLLVGNTTEAHAARYDISDEGLTRYVRDFYSYALNDKGEQDSPLGSHVNVHTAGGTVEGGYLGFTELQYVHAPLPGERLVVFLSDGAFEEQRGSDWAPRWWRAEDSGLVAPIMISNGRRIDQRTTIAQGGGIDWFVEHLRLNSFDPFVFDGRDPAAFAWAIFEMEERLQAAAEAIRRGEAEYPVRLPYGIAVAPKGAGFYGEGENLAHNLPLGGNPHNDERIRRIFNEHARRLWVAPDELRASIDQMSRHDASKRPRERDHPLARRDVKLERVPEVKYIAPPEDRMDRTTWRYASAMESLDDAFASICAANPRLRPRVGNPDEMKSNRMLRTLEDLRFRVTDPEPGIPETLQGAVITALNEEAIAAAALANKGGINITVTYEAFAPKMLGLIRQEVTFATQLKEAGREPGWLSVPLVLTSHTWENGKNEISHQDPTMAEALLAETSDISRVVFAADANSAAAMLVRAYRERGQYWTMVVPKSPTPVWFTADECDALLSHGAIDVGWAGFDRANAGVILTAAGAYQFAEVLRASARLRDRDVAHRVVYMLEPGRYRAPRSEHEAGHVAPAEYRDAIYPAAVTRRIFVTHTRPEAILGAVGPLHTGERTVGLGFINRGGTLDVGGMLHVNRSTWAHIVAEAARLLDRRPDDLLDAAECDALYGRRSPQGVLI